jgi:hypothetical protein
MVTNFFFLSRNTQFEFGVKFREMKKIHMQLLKNFAGQYLANFCIIAS